MMRDVVVWPLDVREEPFVMDEVLVSSLGSCVVPGDFGSGGENGGVHGETLSDCGCHGKARCPYRFCPR